MHSDAATMPKVSVIIPHYGRLEPTLALVQALLAQASPSLEIEVIVVDDCSPIPFPRQAPGIVVVRTERNGGFGTAVNAGASRATGELMLILNSDLEVPEAFVADLVTRSVPLMPAVTSPRVVDRQGDELWTGRRFPKIRHQTIEWLTPLVRLRSRGHLHDAVGRDTRSHGAEGSVAVDFVVGAAMLVPRDAFMQVGGFDERFFMNSEEADLQRRLGDRRTPSFVLDHPVVVHEGGGSSDPGRRRAWLVASRLKYAEKWGHPRALRLSLTGASLVNFAWNALRQLAGRDVDARSTLREELMLIWDSRRSHGNDHTARSTVGN